MEKHCNSAIFFSEMKIQYDWLSTPVPVEEAFVIITDLHLELGDFQTMQQKRKEQNLGYCIVIKNNMSQGLLQEILCDQKSLQT